MGSEVSGRAVGYGNSQCFLLRCSNRCLRLQHRVDEADPAAAAPESEEEIQTMEALFAREKPLVYLSYHSYGNEVLYPYTCASLAEGTLVYDIRNDYKAAMGYGSRTASASGESFEDAYNEHGSMAFLTEVGTSFQPAFSQVQGIVENLRAGWMYLLERGMGPSLVGHVTDAASRAPLPSATIRVREIVFSEGEARNPEPLYGFYNRLLLASDYTVDVGAPGYVPQTFDVTIGAGATVLDVELQPGECPDGDGDGHESDMCGGDDCDDAEPA
ncbi:M14 family zinc carboxypeptidase, partial [Thermodesulfobacteriota bacterium]